MVISGIIAATVWQDITLHLQRQQKASKNKLGHLKVTSLVYSLESWETTVQITGRGETWKNVWRFCEKQTKSWVLRMTLPVRFLPPSDVASDPRAEGRHPPAWLLLPRRRGRGRDHGERLVRARRHRLSSAPGPSAELPGSGEDNGGAAVWTQLVSVLLFSPGGISLRTYIRWWEANIFDCTPQRTPRSCTLINLSSFTTPVRWDWQSTEMCRKYTHTALQMCDSFHAGGGGESRPGALPGVCKGSVSGVCAATRRRALHPSPPLALRPIPGAQLLRQLLVVVTADP